jgi:sigma-B regulation protein RsbU (phosphoserine phosphatase)
MLLPEAGDKNKDADVEIYGRMIPEKEIGGDFFNYSFMEGGRLFFVVADVSGHGIPAALFMMVADLLLLSLIQIGPDIGNAFTMLNHRLCEKNREGYFVTAFAGILETATGRLQYVDAGHNPPYVKSAALSPDGGFRELPCDVNFVLGGLDGIVYTSRETTLRKGDFLFVYTDGVTEAMNGDLELFSKRRLEAALTSVIDENPDATPKEMVERVFEEITRFSGNTEHTDDVTMLGIRL